MGNETRTKNSAIELNHVSKKYPVSKVCVTAPDSIPPLVIPVAYLIPLRISVRDKISSLSQMAILMQLRLPHIYLSTKHDLSSTTR
jgi:hypothetical protein